MHKKDCIPRFKEGVRQQMLKQKSKQITTNNWYNNLDQTSVASRKIQTASGRKRNVQIMNSNDSDPHNIESENESHVRIAKLLDNEILRIFNLPTSNIF